MYGQSWQPSTSPQLAPSRPSTPHTSQQPQLFVHSLYSGPRRRPACRLRRTPRRHRYGLPPSPGPPQRTAEPRAHADCLSRCGPWRRLASRSCTSSINGSFSESCCFGIGNRKHSLWFPPQGSQHRYSSLQPQSWPTTVDESQPPPPPHPPPTH